MPRVSSPAIDPCCSIAGTVYLQDRCCFCSCYCRRRHRRRKRSKWEMKEEEEEEEGKKNIPHYSQCPLIFKQGAALAMMVCCVSTSVAVHNPSSHIWVTYKKDFEEESIPSEGNGITIKVELSGSNCVPYPPYQINHDKNLMNGFDVCERCEDLPIPCR